MDSELTVKCMDGDLQIDRDVYEEHFLVRDFVDSEVTRRWASLHSRADVLAELEELAWK